MRAGLVGRMRAKNSFITVILYDRDKRWIVSRRANARIRVTLAMTIL
jgi:hypothetical protein